MAVIIEDITDQEPPAQEAESREAEQPASAIEEAQITHAVEEDPLKAEEEALKLEPESKAISAGISRLEPLVEQRREKLKDEMLGKLKELGNTVLNKFGMSLDNFKAEKDPSTGSYSIRFQQ
ncbi:hypothetical protein QBZ16_002113 [Prototheca wickerhamii]|uniref:Uncharacterized protein n=1 Tax=Prototheca wickerhamii TaxID=3111 RepID=A0AAD9IK02_PROWI|nr:hypothetical protein QBZ16_002113 [Prototheca wickerhamii]